MTHAKRVDGNHAHLVALARQCGAEVISMTPHPAAGFDALMVRGQNFIVEIKDPAQPPNKRRLTDNEQATKARIEGVGGSYHVIQTDDDLLRMFGLL